MINVDDINNSQLKLVSLHNIDLDNPTSAIPRDIDIEDAQNYILTLTKKMIKYKNVREYTIRSTTTEVISQILELCTNFKSLDLSAISSENDEITSMSIKYLNDNIADRLLYKQIEAEKKYSHLTEIKKGSLIQSLLELEDEYIFIIALVEHHRFIDDNDLKYKDGMPDDEKVALKSARIHLSKEGNIAHIFLSDTTKKITDYWYNEFLELDETKDDITNTKLAYNKYSSLLRHAVYGKSSSDHEALKNALNIYFSHNNTFSHDECVNFLFDSYEPVNADLDLKSIRDKFSECNNKNIFDNTFTIDTTPIKSKLTNTKYIVNDNIELKIKKPLDTIKNGIYTEELSNGEKVLIINNVDQKTLKQFNFNNIDL